MKLLFAEDEKFTREGIRKSIAWGELGITELVEAVDGLEAVAIAEQFQPDIVLTDIRMPRMDGIELATHLRRKYPLCKIVFMSGYADKDYLKAAISLKAVSYVEKPIDIEELEEALRSAIAICLEEQRHLANDAVARDNKSYIKQEAALQLIRGGFDEELLVKRLLAVGFEASLQAPAVTILAKLVTPQPTKENINSIIESALTAFENPYLYALKDDNHVILHLFSSGIVPIESSGLHHVCYELSSALKKEFHSFSIAAGKIVPSVKRLQESYTSAVLRLQESFFHKPCSVILHDSYGSEVNSEHYQVPAELFNRFQEALVEENFEDISRLLNTVTTDIHQHPGTLIVSVKELYYRFALEMDKFARSRNVILFDVSEENNVPWKLILECHFLDDIHRVITQKLDELKQSFRERGNGSMSSASSRIIRYIHLHFAEDNLSVQDVSDHMQMTASHLISIFKEATGKTIKQYVTEYRMEKAKDLLRNNRLKVLDVASQVGFKDGEHFAKIFRKSTGMTPSEYRERCQL
ncbi:two-component system response regulator YesN [Paenibacillus sp. V4I3]|uniref:response regulator n=1 Tax=unclassified Paenibacillus TaxID=185978 RepID=UPI002782C586|nr:MULTISPECIES: response regulator [unclassified Paenibacillus]MDQ0877039.1 two-component system response regulator YesN [Paenibacillus sp. V4I3]MDQ0887081.1 two-component system response regulator YesN [Paenibacillus sp. V4I9]